MSELGNNMKQDNEPNSFGLPDDYFQKSGLSIMNKILWDEEHAEFPKLLAVKKGKGFMVPENYFQIKEIALELSDYTNLFSIPKQTGFIVPAAYFEELEVKELGRNFVKGVDELVYFPHLKTLPKKNAFVLDENYFAENAERLNAMLTEHKPSLIFSLIFSKASYAVAAMLVIALGFWIYLGYFKPINTGDCGTLACVDKSDLLKTKNLEGLDEEELFELVNTVELEKKLGNNETTKPSKSGDSSLKQISADELLDEI